MHVSDDGVHWSDPVATSAVGDNTSFFYNPFRKKWVMSIRRNVPSINPLLPIGKRSRFYHESDDFLKGAVWDSFDEVFWCTTDEKDAVDSRFPNHIVALYDVNAIAYESMMIGLFGIFRGPENNICEELGIPKTIDLEIGFSRDGFNFFRPERVPFLESSRKEKTWNRGYLHACGGICCVFKEKLRFYVSGFSGNSPKLHGSQTGTMGRARNAMYAGASVGIAELRRDGFASMEVSSVHGFILTKILKFSGTFLFVNCDASRGFLACEIVLPEGKVVPGYSKEECVMISSDSVKTRIMWKTKKDLKELIGKDIRFKFYLNNCSLYSFWVSTSEAGHSGGYLGAGSKDYDKYIDF